MTDQLQTLGFHASYTVEVDPEFPGDGDWGCPLYGSRGTARQLINSSRDGVRRWSSVSGWCAPMGGFACIVVSYMAI
ncbi:MAG: hypothetical protein QOG43_59 [Actinomycetota bacterium]|jgi:hypothetical protein|nr:hypothetical protein [Actinomycetota bacterium]